MPRTGFNPKALHRFMQDRDRETPLFFAGRATEIQTIRDTARHVGRGRVAGLTQIVTGAPGAGKTALLSELQARWAEDGQAHVVTLNPGDFARPEHALRTFLRQLSPSAARRAGATITGTTGGQATVSGKAPIIGGAGGSVHKSRSTQHTDTPRSFRDAARLLPGKARSKPIALLVDEAQNWAPNRIDPPDVPRSDLLDELHQGNHGLPLLLIAAGLSNTEDRFQDLGISRLASDSVQVLEPLSADEQREAVARFFAHFRIRGGATRKAEWADAIVAMTQGWPQHLANGLRAAAAELIGARGDADRASLGAACARAEEYREHYYSRRLGRLAGMPTVLSAVFSVLDSQAGTSMGLLKKAIAVSYQAEPELTREMDEAHVLGEMQRLGLIQKDWRHRYRCPIPSLRRYVEEFCRNEAVPVRSAAGPVPQAERTARNPEPDQTPI